ncbi:MAG: hypothetical protein GYB68_16745 [Chloroflexi bacterium]|nr:hypothetical protein [Chloroflexota bacterium]
MTRQILIPLAVVALLFSASCATITNLVGSGDAQPEELAPTETVAPTPTTFELAPTLPPDDAVAPTATTETAEAEPTPDLAPTPLPEPTQIGATEAPEGEEEADDAEGEGDTDDGSDEPADNEFSPPPVPTGPGISISPAVGEPLDVIFVVGTGFAPNEIVELYWTSLTGTIGEVYYEQAADESGNFQVTFGLIVPPAERWPGGSAQEGDILQLRAYASSLGDEYFFANYTYIERFDPFTSLTQTFDNPDYDYVIDIADGWIWDWEGDIANAVRFETITGDTGFGFILVYGSDNTRGTVDVVMAQEAPGRTFTVEDVQFSGLSGLRATADNGLVVFFVSRDGRTYAISFTNVDGNVFSDVLSTFRFE